MDNEEKVRIAYALLQLAGTSMATVDELMRTVPYDMDLQKLWNISVREWTEMMTYINDRLGAPSNE